MTMQVNVHEAKSRLSELLARVEQGEEFTIARAGRPIPLWLMTSEATHQALLRL